MNNRKLEVDTKEMLGFRLIKKSRKTTGNQLIGSKIGGKGLGPVRSIIGSKIGVKA